MYKSQEARDAQAQGGSERYCAFLDKQAAKREAYWLRLAEEVGAALSASQTKETA